MSYNVYKQTTSEKKSPLWIKIVGAIFAAIFVCFMGFVMYLNMFLEYHPVTGGSMFPLLNNNGIDEDFVYSAQTKDVERGDIVIYNTNHQDVTDGAFIQNEETGEEKLVIKRLIGLGGDHIMVRASGQYIGTEEIYEICIKYNGEGDWSVLDDSYASSRVNNFKLHETLCKLNTESKNLVFDEEFQEYYLVIPENYFFAIGDNRLTSYDCAAYGPMPISSIHGKVRFIVFGNKYPIFQALGQFFGGQKWK